MSEKDKDELREHDYDGIQEYDNDMPRWWIWLFWITIVFSAIYPFVYDFGPLQFASESIEEEMLALEENKKAKESTGGGITEEHLLALAKDEDVIAKGQMQYTLKCFACHAEKGAGLVGPNLTDDYWLHGGKITDIHKVVSNGVLEKGMLAWKDQMKPEQLNSVVAFIWSLRGTNPPGAKAPQGELVKR